MLRALKLVVLASLILQFLVTITVAAAPEQQPPLPPVSRSGLPFEPGKLLVKFKPDVGERAAETILATHGLHVHRRFPSLNLWEVEVPAGRELLLASALEADLAIEFAVPNHIVTLAADEAAAPLSARPAEPSPLADVWPWPLAGPAWTSAGDEPVVDVWMSSAPGGPPPFENKFPSTISTVYAVFTYTVGTPGQPLRVEVIYQDAPTGPTTVFTHTEVYTGTGTASVAIPVGVAFPGRSQFGIGRYSTTVYRTEDGGQTWGTAATLAEWRVVVRPRDPFYERFQWNLNNTGQGGHPPDVDIDAPEAWEITTGRSDVTIAVVSGGVYLGEHEDLRSKLWVNTGEIPDNGVDDDGNGYVDDVHGYDFTDEHRLEAWASPVGTYLASIAAAATDNERGMAGVSWGARIMSVKVLKKCGDGSVCGTLEDAVEGMIYAVDNGARIIVPTFYVLEDAGIEPIQALQSVVDYAYQRGVLVVTGAGDKGEASPVVYPSALTNVMAVSGTKADDRRTGLSSCGYWVDVAAPAEGVIIAIPCADPSYCEWGEARYAVTVDWGARSVYAAAHVAGLAALVWSVNPNLSVDEVRAIIEGTADKVDADRYPYDQSGRNNCYGYGRINAERALLATTHVLTLSHSSLSFLMNDITETPACYTITNPNTGAITWRVSTDAEWLNLDGPFGLNPSQVQACVDRSAVPEPAVYSGVITATSTLANHAQNPVVIPVTLVYTHTIHSLRLPLVFERGQLP